MKNENEINNATLFVEFEGNIDVISIKNNITKYIQFRLFFLGEQKITPRNKTKTDK